MKLDDKIIKTVVQRILTVFFPKQIILFGSAASSNQKTENLIRCG